MGWSIGDVLPSNLILNRKHELIIFDYKIFNSNPFCTPQISANSSSQRSFHQTSLAGVTERWFWAKFGSTVLPAASGRDLFPGGW